MDTPVNQFIPTLKSLNDREFVQWQGDGLNGDLLLTGDAVQDEQDAWIVVDAKLALALAAEAPPQVDLNHC